MINLDVAEFVLAIFVVLYLEKSFFHFTIGIFNVYVRVGSELVCDGGSVFIKL